MGSQKDADAMVPSDFPTIVVKTDNATRLAREETAIEVVSEESNEYVSQTGGFVEEAEQAVERRVRTFKFSVESKFHGVMTLLPNHLLLVSPVEDASQMTNRSHKYQ